ncbi:glycosyltransferase family 2 protein [Halomonas sp. ML-15]|uniref:glycosyltransferase family 2 protein n=1 Tax=Halomonas sp. ML-15 TaxID=2773305 RepID=UPI0017462B0E|nr:glycosyltransferase family A protein [Halomonas sp. ML-15]MBD3896211.1 glycosyltransferase family 2 protein [Halomonas sp. ML-15]
MFSVIIPVHNKKEHVVAAIESVLAQTYDDFELILIDDCSSDGSAELIRAYESPKVSILSRDTPGPGGYAARNLGVERASYQWITFLDADDVWYPNHLQTARDLIQKYQDVGFFSLSREKIFKGEKGGYFHAAEEQISCHSALKRFSRKDIFHTNAVVINRDLYLAAGGFPAGKCKRGGDSDLWLRLLLECDSLVVSPIVTSCYALDNSGVIYGKAKVETVHPVQNTVMSHMRRNPNANNAADLKRLSNRKSLSWLVARKRSGDFSLGELGVIYFESLDSVSIKQLIKLLIPFSGAKKPATSQKKVT